MTSLKKISHLFLTGRQPVQDPGVYRPASGNRPLHTVLIADPSRRGISGSFSSNLARELSRKIGTVLLFNAGHALTAGPLLARYQSPDKGSGPYCIKPIVDSFGLGEQFDAVYPALSGTNLLLITDAHMDGRDWPVGYLHIIDTLIMLIGPDSDPERIRMFSAYVARANPSVALCSCISADTEPRTSEQLSAKLPENPGKGSGAGMIHLGQVPATRAPRQIVMGGRLVNLSRPEVIQAMEQAYQALADRLLRARPPAAACAPACDVLHALSSLLVRSSPQLFMNQMTAEPCTKRFSP
jgi:hypothetical protein